MKMKFMQNNPRIAKAATWFKNNSKKSIAAAAFVAIGAFSAFLPNERNAAIDYAWNSVSGSTGAKTEQVECSKIVSPIDTLNKINPSGDSVLIETSMTITSKFLTSEAKASDSLKNGASSQVVEKKIGTAKKVTKEVAKKNARFTIESDGTYVFDMTNPANAKLANRYGISGFVKFAMQDAGIYNGINADFMKIVDDNCDLNLGARLKDCDTWNVRELNVKNKMVISFGGSQETHADNKITRDTKSTDEPQSLDSGSTNIRPEFATLFDSATGDSVIIHCDEMLEILGIDSLEQANIAFNGDKFVVDYNDVDSVSRDLPYDSLFVSDLNECDLIIGNMPEFKPNGPSITPYEGDDFDSSTTFTPLSKQTTTFTPADTIPKQLKTSDELDKTKTDTLQQGGIQQIKDTESEKDKSKKFFRSPSHK